MTVTCQMTLMKLRISLDAGVRCIFDWNSPLSRKQYEIGTDPVNIKHPVAWVSQHQLSFLCLLRVYLPVRYWMPWPAALPLCRAAASDTCWSPFVSTYAADKIWWARHALTYVEQPTAGRCARRPATPHPSWYVASKPWEQWSDTQRQTTAGATPYVCQALHSRSNVVSIIGNNYTTSMYVNGSRLSRCHSSFETNIGSRTAPLMLIF